MPLDIKHKDRGFKPGDLVRARGREWVVLPERIKGALTLRPLTGNEDNVSIVKPSLEIGGVEPAVFELPEDAEMSSQPNAALLADALRLTLRRGAGPFRCAAQIGFTPRLYQLVPLIMALRLPVARLLIADDVGIGKTVEAGLILRELMDRGEVRKFTVLCPPHLIEQWVIELRDKFGIDAVAVTAASAPRLERDIPPAESIFTEYPHTVVSLDYIKAEKRCERFKFDCPDFVIVDEAHTCVGTGVGKGGSVQRRFDFLKDIAADQERRIIMLTATPHSGDEKAFHRLIELINKEFNPDMLHGGGRKILAKQFVQRRRPDLVDEDWGEDRSFPRHEKKECKYNLSSKYLEFHQMVLDHCLARINTKSGEQRNSSYWETISLMRCVCSSPAAAIAALENRRSRDDREQDSQVYADRVSGVFDDGDEGDAMDMEPGVNTLEDPFSGDLMNAAEELRKVKDPKLEALVDELTPLIRKGANPVVFCRYISTAKYLGDHLPNKLKGREFKNLSMDYVTGEFPPAERRRIIEKMTLESEEAGKQRLLIATDCLSEGINLQQWFDTVVHYDLCWNPTRHQQREGRVDRFGQPAKTVHSVMLFSPDSSMDGAVLQVILNKAERIKKVTGVMVPLPDDKESVTKAILNAVVLGHRDGKNRQLALDLKLEDGTRVMNEMWRDSEEGEKAKQTIFAQFSMKPAEVRPEWEKATRFLGSPEDARVFVDRTMAGFGVPLEEKGRNTFVAHVHALKPSMSERLKENGLKDSVKVAIEEPASTGTSLLTRTHPLVTGIAECIVEASLDSESTFELGIGRVGMWDSGAVSARTLIALLRIRHKINIRSKGQGVLLAEEAAVVSVVDGTITGDGESARAMLNSPALSDLSDKVKSKGVKAAYEEMPRMLNGPFRKFAESRAKELQADYGRLRESTGERGPTTSLVDVEAVIPIDVIALYTLISAK